MDLKRIKSSEKAIEYVRHSSCLWGFKCVLNLINKIKFNKVLDVGCGVGLFEVLANKKIYPLDLNLEKLKEAKKLGIDNLSLGDACNLPCKDNSFDIVTSIETLQYVTSPLKTLKEIKRVLKKDGKAVIAIPNNNSLFRISNIFRKRLKKKLNLVAEPETTKFNLKKIKDLIESAGFNIKYFEGTGLGGVYLLNFLKIAFIKDFKKVISFEEKTNIFKNIEKRLSNLKIFLPLANEYLLILEKNH